MQKIPINKLIIDNCLAICVVINKHRRRNVVTVRILQESVSVNYSVATSNIKFIMTSFYALTAAKP